MRLALINWTPAERNDVSESIASCVMKSTAKRFGNRRAAARNLKSSSVNYRADGRHDGHTPNDTLNVQ